MLTLHAGPARASLRAEQFRGVLANGVLASPLVLMTASFGVAVLSGS